MTAIAEAPAPAQPAQEERSARREQTAARRNEIISAYLADGTVSLAAIGKRHGVTREWVRQIVRDCGIPADEIERLRAADAARRSTEAFEGRAAAVRAALSRDPGISTIEGLSCASGVPAREIQSHRSELDDVFAALRVRLRRRQSQALANAVQYDEGDMISALRRVAALCGGAPLTAPRYQQERREGEPSLTLINSRFGGFVSACKEAGVPCSGHRPKPSRYSETDYAAAIRRCAEECADGRLEDLGSYVYSDWAKVNSAPSLSRVRQIFGNWNRAKIAVERATS